MTNSYYNFTDPAISFAVVDGLAYNREMTKVTEAFDNFPPAIQFTSGAFNYGVQTGASPIQYIVNVPAIQPGTNYDVGNNIAGRLLYTNTGATTLSVSLNAALEVFMSSAGPTVANDLKADGIYTFVYDGSRWITLEMSTRYLGIAEQKAVDAANSAATAATAKTTAESYVVPAANSAATAFSASGSAVLSYDTANQKASDAILQRLTAINAAAAASDSAITAGQRATAATNSATAAQSSANSANTSLGTANAANASAFNSQQSASVSEAEAADAYADAQDILTDPGLQERIHQVVLEVELVVNSVELFAANIDPNTLHPGTTWVRLPASASLQMVALSDASDVLQIVGQDTAALTSSTTPAHSHEVPPVTTSNTTPTITMGNTNLGSPNVANDIATTKSSSFSAGSVLTTTGYAYSITVQPAGAHYHVARTVIPNAGGVVTGQIKGTNLTTAGNLTLNTTGDHNHSLTAPQHTHGFTLGPHAHSVLLPDHDHTLTLPPHAHTITLGPHTHTGNFASGATGSGTAFSVLNSNIKLVAWYRTA